MRNSFSRRDFLKTSSLAVAGAAVLPRLPLGNVEVPHLGIQLWSVRDDMGKDPAGTIKALAKMGYKEVEGFGYGEGKMFGMPYKDFVMLLKDNGISMPSSHVMFTSASYDASTKSLNDASKKAIDDAVSGGQKYIVCPYMADPDRLIIDKMIPVYQAAGEYANKAGIRFGYHNHNFEFEKRGPDNRLLIEWLLHEVDPKLMAMEMDIYWVRKAMHNPLDWFRLYPGRWELCHAKDMANTEKQDSIEVGDGVIDFNEIFKQSKLAGLKYYIIELENYVTTPMQGAERSLQGFKKLVF
ncbi:MAG: TIM barrel protein [Bacteroidetes bacterium]|nr:TIM barrel protein [Bacteroidota bacterium]